MSEIAQEVVEGARMRLGKPFTHHFKQGHEAADRCKGGRETKDECMWRGMDDRGYDCSGLVVACICDVLGISTDKWPRDFRHARQLIDLSADDVGRQPGDLRVYISSPGLHIGIVTQGEEVVHASGGDIQSVEEGIVISKHIIFSEVRLIRLADLLLQVSAA